MAEEADMSMSGADVMETIKACCEPIVGSAVERGAPEWVTPEIASQMASQVVAAVMEAGHPDVEAHRHDGANYYFTGAPHDVLRKAGQLVRAHWGID